MVSKGEGQGRLRGQRAFAMASRQRLKTALRAGAAVSLCAVLSGPVFASADGADDRLRFDIPRQSAQQTLLDFARQAKVPILIPKDAFSNVEANPLRGEYSVEQALDILFRGTGLTAQIDRSGQLIVETQTSSAAQVDEQGESDMPAENRTRRGLLASAIAAVISGAGAQAAQAQQDDAQASNLEEITVTGSRIRATSGFTTAVPVTAVTTEELFDMEPGNTISAQLDALPQFFDSRTTQNAGPGGGSSIVGSPAAGLNMRNLGGNRTLVLLDGSRVVPSDKQGMVNVDLFPTALMRTVDVVTGGASAAYGADAVGGVVNFVLDREFEGLEINAGFGVHEGGVGKSEQFEFAGGTSLFDGRLHVIGSLQSREMDEIAADWTRMDNYQFWGHIRNPEWSPGAAPGTPLRLTRPWVMSTNAAPTGLIAGTRTSLDNMKFTVDGTGVEPFVPGEGFCQGGAGCQTSMAGGPEAAARQQGFTRAEGPKGNGAVARSGLLGLQYDVSDRLAVHWQGMVGRTESIRAENVRFYPPLNAGWTPIIFADNAYLPEEVRDVLEANDLSQFQIRKQGSLAPFHDVGSDEASRDVYTNWNWKLGVDYTIPGVEWDFQASYQRGESKRNSQMDNMLRHDRLHLAMDAVRHPTTGEIVCRVKVFNPTREDLLAWGAASGLDSTRPLSPYIPAGEPGNTQPLPAPIGLDNTVEDCVPLNIFGSGNMSREALDYIGTWKGSRGNVDQDFAEALVSGELYEGWGAGPVGFAFGLTWRDQQFIEGAVPEEIDILGTPRNVPELGIQGFPPSVENGTGSLHALAQIPYVGGQADVWEWFTEFSVPVFETSLLFGQTQTLGANLAYRQSEYDRSGKADSWKIGLDLQVVEDLRLRLTRSRDMREPTFFELFDAQANAANASDPRFNDESYTFSQVQGGSPTLRPEVANTTVAGVVWQPTFTDWLEGLQLSLDFFQVDIEDSVELLGVQNIVDECEAGVQSLCQQIVRDPTSGRLVKVFNTYLNVAEASTEGVDMEVVYRSEPDFFGDQFESFSLRWLSSYVKERSNTPFGGTATDSSNTTGTPDFTSVLTASYGIGAWSFQLQGRYIDSVRRNANWVEGVDVDDNTVASMTWWNTKLGYSGEFGNGSTYNVNLNVQNIFDRDQPIVAGFSNFTGGGQSVGNPYDQYGRRYNLSFNYGF